MYLQRDLLQKLQQRLESTPESERPDGVLVIDSGLFQGFGMAANGPLGLYAMCLAINVLFTQIGFASPDLALYARE